MGLTITAIRQQIGHVDADTRFEPWIGHTVNWQCLNFKTVLIDYLNRRLSFSTLNIFQQ